MQISGKTNNIGYAHANDGGADLRSNEDTIIPANGRTLVHTGVYAAIPCNHVGLVCPRSGLALNQGLTVLNAPGIIDSNYRGELCVILRNTSERAVKITTRHRATMPIIVEMIRSNPSVAFLTRVKRQKATIRLTVVDDFVLACR